MLQVSHSHSFSPFCSLASSESRGANGDKSLVLLVSLGAAVVITWSDPCFQPSEKNLAIIPEELKSLIRCKLLAPRAVQAAKQECNTQTTALQPVYF